MANILVLNPKVPFSRGGQDLLVRTLVLNLKKRGHIVDTISLPFNPLPKTGLIKQAALWRSLSLEEFAGQKVNLVIATKFPSYWARHPRKSLWLVHQHRPLYELTASRYSDLSDSPQDQTLRELLIKGDEKSLKECRYRACISKNVQKRLQHFCQISSDVLYPPLKYEELPAGRKNFNSDNIYILSVGRLCAIKRVDLVIKALPYTPPYVKLKIVGSPDEPGILEYLETEISKHDLWNRVEFIKGISDEELKELYQNALCVCFLPYDEDYGYVTLESICQGTPVITAKDSGGALEFITNMETGLVVEPKPEAVGKAISLLESNRELALKLGENGKRYIEKNKDIFLASAWDRVINLLLSPLKEDLNEREAV
ncbi:MAG: glycosyltransferase [Candidatus Dadabacteria bacterium]|nr:MAG: glycosyltransferase [Candidatus Dadabacteria bacterium]